MGEGNRCGRRDSAGQRDLATLDSASLRAPVVAPQQLRIMVSGTARRHRHRHRHRRAFSLLDPRTGRERAERVAARALRVRRWNRLPSEGPGPRGLGERGERLGRGRAGRPEAHWPRELCPCSCSRVPLQDLEVPARAQPPVACTGLAPGMPEEAAPPSRRPFPPATHPPAPGTCSRHRPPAPGAENGVSRARHPPRLWSPGVRALTVKLPPLSSLHPGGVSVRSTVQEVTGNERANIIRINKLRSRLCLCDTTVLSSHSLREENDETDCVKGWVERAWT
ncbi:uncharacterized protein LOC144582031 [Callithrix jacchus]